MVEHRCVIDNPADVAANPRCRNRLLSVKYAYGTTHEFRLPR